MVSLLFLCVAGLSLINCIRVTETTTTEEEEVMAVDGAVEVEVEGVTTMTGCPTSGAGCGLSTGLTHGLRLLRRTSTSRTSGSQAAVKRKLKTFDVPRRFEWVFYSSYYCITQLTEC